MHLSLLTLCCIASCITFASAAKNCSKRIHSKKMLEYMETLSEEERKLYEEMADKLDCMKPKPTALGKMKGRKSRGPDGAPEEGDHPDNSTQLMLNDDDFYFQGDLELNLAMMQKVITDFGGDDESDDEGRKKRKVTANAAAVWPDPQNIHYHLYTSAIDATIPRLLNTNAIQPIRDAITTIESLSCINMIEGGFPNTGQPFKIVFYSNVGSDGNGVCTSDYIGYKEPFTSHNYQLVSIGTGCETSTSMNDYGNAYDFGSLMHYGHADFLASGQTGSIILANEELYQRSMRVREFSFIDLKQLNDHYCSGTCTATLNCENKGYPDPKDCTKCVCPKGFSGTLCDQVEVATGTGTCGLSTPLAATTVWQSLTDYKPSGSECIWHIASPTGTQIEMRFTSLTAWCLYGCYGRFVEVKSGIDEGFVGTQTEPDFARAGYRFCCVSEALNNVFTSFANLAVVRMKSNPLYTANSVGFTLEYRYVGTINPCQSNPCQNGGACVNSGTTSYTCNCQSGYTGTNCQTPILPCQSNPCQNDGACINSGTTSYTCNCQSGYTGTNCQTPILPCQSNPCQNDGACINSGTTSYTCNCPSGYTGTNCQNGAVTTTGLETDCHDSRGPCYRGYYPLVSRCNNFYCRLGGTLVRTLQARADGSSCGMDQLCQSGACVNTSLSLVATDGGWSDWEENVSHSCADCGDTNCLANGIQPIELEIRQCNDPIPFNGGQDCDGHNARAKECGAPCTSTTSLADYQFSVCPSTTTSVVHLGDGCRYYCKDVNGTYLSGKDLPNGAPCYGIFNGNGRCHARMCYTKCVSDPTYYAVNADECPVADSTACNSNPCLNNATCINVGTSNYSCVCASFYTGINCQTLEPPETIGLEEECHDQHGPCYRGYYSHVDHCSFFYCKQGYKYKLMHNTRADDSSCGVDKVCQSGQCIASPIPLTATNGEWSDWDGNVAHSCAECSDLSCLASGIQPIRLEVRQCNNPIPYNGGQDCAGNNLRAVECGDQCNSGPALADYFLSGCPAETTYISYTSEGCRYYCRDVNNGYLKYNLSPNGSPCNNTPNGICHNGHCYTKCASNSGYYAIAVEECPQGSACDSGPCQNEGTCETVPSNSNLYTCTCPSFYTGLTCETLEIPDRVGLEEECHDKHGPCFRGYYPYVDRCNYFYCRQGYGPYKYASTRADDSSCGVDKVCHSGQCVNYPGSLTATNGGWSDWDGNVSHSCAACGDLSCPATGIQPIRVEVRTCDNPIPYNGGQYCNGYNLRAVECGPACTSGTAMETYMLSVCPPAATYISYLSDGCRYHCRDANNGYLGWRILPNGSPCNNNPNGRCYTGQCFTQCESDPTYYAWDSDECPVGTTSDSLSSLEEECMNQFGPCYRSYFPYADKCTRMYCRLGNVWAYTNDARPDGSSCGLNMVVC